MPSYEYFLKESLHKRGYHTKSLQGTKFESVEQNQESHEKLVMNKDGYLEEKLNKVGDRNERNQNELKLSTILTSQ